MTFNDPSAIPHLIPLLKDPVEDVRYRAVLALDCGDAKAFEPLAAALKDRAWHVRERAVWGLENLGGEKAIAAIATVADDPHTGVRRAAADALKALGDPRGREKMLELVKSLTGRRSGVSGRPGTGPRWNR